MNLHADWRRLLFRAWSIRWMALAMIASGAEVAFSVFAQNPPCDPVWFALASALTTAFAFCARLVAQKAFCPKGDDE